MRRVIVLFVLVGALPAGAQPAQPPANGTNFPVLADYPDPACPKPPASDMPARPARPGSVDAASVDRYNFPIKKYNMAMHDYVVCVNAYVRNAENDEDIIRKKSRDALDQANAP